MKSRIVKIAVLLAVTVMVSCRSNEANYRAAYEQAVAGRDNAGGIDNTIYEKIRREAVNTQVAVNGDTVNVKRERVVLQDAAQGEKLQGAYIVMAQFKQRFNAMSLRDRLRSNGFPDATVLVTREPLYYVALNGGSEEDMTSRCRDIVAEAQNVYRCRDPYPVVLVPVK